MNLFRAKHPLVVFIIFLFSCSSTPDYNKYRTITLNAPNCPLAECKLRYETEPQIWEKIPPLSFSINNLNKDLFVACEAKTEENRMVQSIIVKPGINTITHPIDCSLLTNEEAINIEKINLAPKDPLKKKESTTEDGQEILNLQPQDTELNTETDIDTSKKLTEYSLNETVLKQETKDEEKDKDKKLNEIESQEKKAFKENIAQDLLDQIETLYKQGLISKESYEKEIEIIKNIYSKN